MYIILNDKINNMKFSMKKLLLSLSSATLISSSFLTISCSSTSSNFSLSSNSTLYSTMWNISSVFSIVKDSIFDYTVEELENVINKSLKNDTKNNKIMKSYVFYLLWEAINNPKSESGSSIPNLSSEISDYSTFLYNKLAADDSNVDDDEKTYKKFSTYIDTFDYKISILNFNNEELNSQETIRDIFNSNSYILNFKIDFWTSDSETNEKMVNSTTKRSIMYRNTLTREQRQIIEKIKDPDLKKLTTNQFNYQSTKLYYDVETKKFSSIVLPSNVYSGMTEATPNSGFSSSDKKRELFIFDWTSASETSTSFESTMSLLLSNSSNFSSSFNSNWSRYLEYANLSEDVDGDKKIKNVQINLNKKINVDLSEYYE